MLACTSEGAGFAKAAQVWVASHTISISLAGFAKLSSSDIKHPHYEQEEEDVDRHNSELLLGRCGEIARIAHGSHKRGSQRKLSGGNQNALGPLVTRTQLKIIGCHIRISSAAIQGGEREWSGWLSEKAGDHCPLPKLVTTANDVLCVTKAGSLMVIITQRTSWQSDVQRETIHMKLDKLDEVNHLRCSNTKKHEESIDWHPRAVGALQHVLLQRFISTVGAL